MNIDPSKADGNGSASSPSVSSSPMPYLANGGYPDRSYSCLSNDITFPLGGIQSLRLPVVVVLLQKLTFFARKYLEFLGQYACIVG